MKNRSSRFVFTSSIVGILISFLSSSESVQAQQAVSGQVYWDVQPGNGAIYLNICTDNQVHIDARTGGCAKINMVNANVTKDGGLRVIEKKLPDRGKFRGCIVADNTPGLPGRWLSCQSFTSFEGFQLSFPAMSMRRIR